MSGDATGRSRRESWDADAFLALAQEQVNRDCAEQAASLRKEVRTKKKKRTELRQDVDQPLTTLEEIWEQICSTHGPSPFSIEAHTMLDIFRQCQDAGLGPRLNVAITPKVNPESLVDMEWRDFAYLFALALDRKSGPVEDWSAELLDKRCESDFISSDFHEWSRIHRDDILNLVQFKRLIPAVSDVMQLDEEYVLSGLVWVEASRFEMPLELYQRFFEKNSKERFLKGAGAGASSNDVYVRLFNTNEPKPESAGAFSRNDFDRLCYGLEIVDHTEQRGRMWAFWSEWWDDTLRKMPAYIEDYINRRPGQRASSPASPLLKKDFSAKIAAQPNMRKTLEGRTELTVFLELLFKQLPDGRYQSPLDMCIAFLGLPEDVGDDRLKQLFRDRDADGNGTIDYEELSALLRSGNPNMTEKEITALWNAADQNGDGMLDFEEFVDFITSEEQSWSVSQRASLQTTGTAPTPKRTLKRSQSSQSMSSATASTKSRPLRRTSTAPSLDDVQNIRLKNIFHDRDTDGNGMLDYNELKQLLKSGNPRMQDKKIKLLFESADADKSGFVEFEEFVDFLNSDAGGTLEEPSSPTFSDTPNSATTRSRKSNSSTRTGASAAPSMGHTESMGHGKDAIGKKALRQIFAAVSGRDQVLDGQEFSRLCRTANLYDSAFKNNDTDIIFAKACVKGERKLKFAQFQTALRLVAEKKDCDLGVVQTTIAEALNIQ